MAKEIKGFQLPGLDTVYTFPMTPVDGSLTNSGEAADAKVVGEKIKEINQNFNEEIPSIKESIKKLEEKDTSYSLEKEGSKIALKLGEKEISFVTDKDTTYKRVSASEDGLAPKLSGSLSQFLRGDGAWGTPENTTYTEATESKSGLMSKEDKIKLNNLFNFNIESFTASKRLDASTGNNTWTQECDGTIQILFITMRAQLYTNNPNGPLGNGAITAFWTPLTSGTKQMLYGYGGDGQSTWAASVIISDKTFTIKVEPSSDSRAAQYYATAITVPTKS